MKNSLVWFTNNLRVFDNKVLKEACDQADTMYAIYCFDPRQFAETQFGFKKTGVFRAQFLIESVQNLSENLKRLNIPLYIKFAKPEEQIPKLCQKHNITHVYHQNEWTQEEKKCIKNVSKAIPNTVNLVGYYDQFLFHPEDIPYNSISDISDVFTAFRKKCEKHSLIHQPLEKPEKYSDKNWFNTQTKTPTIEELGLKPKKKNPQTAFPFSGGEKAAWGRLQNYFWETKNLSQYKHTRNGLIGKNYSSKFSAWLSNGSLSPRAIYSEVKKYESKVEKNQDTYWLIFELIWRDYFKFISLKYGNAIFKQGGILHKEYSWKKDSAIISNWIEGVTKYDFVNANMKEIAATGFMSNRGRQNVASYFAKEMKQDWRVGASYFESMLIDYDVHSNWGNWMYNSGVGNDPRDRKFNIESQAERYDKDKKYRDLWLKKR
ncbi:DASH family cryptochrome [Marixanthomonas sp. SCSIO 43207]|uniref:DASH family cryptochrome n=1 Tax=Marixanthomonas sp. SCSIO 43207 TaxID=2779360 RepID=UPI001CA81FED|nr:DASH family cryptochrome [Marixanthomonas sp. SCSIO 43207]UAB81396.1 DASH family cryptochrome [Marixanthomonas sp. SCSIO 43207]